MLNLKLPNQLSMCLVCDLKVLKCIAMHREETILFHCKCTFYIKHKHIPGGFYVYQDQKEIYWFVLCLAASALNSKVEI